MAAGLGAIKMRIIGIVALGATLGGFALAVPAETATLNVIGTAGTNGIDGVGAAGTDGGLRVLRPLGGFCLMEGVQGGG
jgi:hypothetical protein